MHRFREILYYKSITNQLQNYHAELSALSKATIRQNSCHDKIECVIAKLDRKSINDRKRKAISRVQIRDGISSRIPSSALFHNSNIKEIITHSIHCYLIELCCIIHARTRLLMRAHVAHRIYMIFVCLIHIPLIIQA